jgi:DNA-binding transcriptional LysR family regulator
MFSWERLRVFDAVARLGSVAAAAETLHITAPAVSQQLRKLEREVGCALVEPHGRGIRLTSAGRVLAGSARAMSHAAEVAATDLANIGETVAGPLRIGAMASAVRTLLPEVLHALVDAYPRIQPWLSDGEVAELLPALDGGRLDAVIIEDWADAPVRLPVGVRLTSLLSEEVELAVPESHPWANLDAIRLDELHGQVWATCRADSDTNQAVVQTLRRHGVPVQPRYQVVDCLTQLTLVAAGLAVALIPRSARPERVPGVRFLAGVPAVSRELAVVTRDGEQPAPVRAFLAELLARAEDRTVTAGPLSASSRPEGLTTVQQRD